MTQLAISNTIAATLKRSARRRSIGIKVLRGEVWVSAPTGMPVADITQFVQQKRGWIEKHLARQQQNLSASGERLYLSGETVPFLGQALTLQTGAAARPIRMGDVLQLGAANAGLAQRKAAVQTWYIEQAKAYLPPRIEHFQAKLGVQPRAIKIRHYKSRWGSCNHRGELQFNWLLMMAPATVVDYVVVHELAHLRHFNHSAAFWQLVASVMPDYTVRRQWLKRQTTLYW